MTQQKKQPPCSGFEFAIRRQAVGLDNATFMKVSGFSISSLTKWNAGQMAVSRKAYRLLEEIEVAVEREVQRMVDEAELWLDKGADNLSLSAFNPFWRYGESTYTVAVCRARRILQDAHEVDLRITPPPGTDLQSAAPFLYGAPEAA